MISSTSVFVDSESSAGIGERLKTLDGEHDEHILERLAGLLGDYPPRHGARRVRSRSLYLSVSGCGQEEEQNRENQPTHEGLDVVFRRWCGRHPWSE